MQSSVCNRCGATFEYEPHKMAGRPRTNCDHCRSHHVRKKPDTGTCLQCGACFQQSRERGAVRKFCSKACYAAAYKVGGIYYTARSVVSFPDCVDCGQVFCVHRGKKTGEVPVCRECRLIRNSSWMRAYGAKNKALIRGQRRRHDITCAECGNQGKSMTPAGKFCSAVCCARANGRGEYEPIPKTDDERARKRARGERRQQRLRDGFVAKVDRRKVFEADGYKCYLCNRKCLPNKKAPHPRSPTIDHVIPLAQGGTHEPLNCRTACHRCNVIKGARGGGEQLLLLTS